MCPSPPIPKAASWDRDNVGRRRAQPDVMRNANKLITTQDLEDTCIGFNTGGRWFCVSAQRLRSAASGASGRPMKVYRRNHKIADVNVAA